MHKIGCGKKTGWLSIVLFVRDLVTNMSIFTDSQKEEMQNYVFKELKLKDSSSKHFHDMTCRLEDFMIKNKKTLEIEEKLGIQNEFTSSMVSAVSEFVSDSFASEKERGRLIDVFGQKTLEALGDKENMDVMIPRLKVLLKDMLVHYRQEAKDWERKARLLEQTVNVDPLLAPLHNRRYLENYLQEAVERSRLVQSQLSVLMIDVDNFKGVNDAYGHQVGDDVLRALAKIVGTYAAQYNWLVARYGGDEIVVVCDVAADEALFHSDAIRLAVQKYEFRQRIDGKIAGQPIKFTVSIGVAEYVVGMSSDELLNCSDKAMYQVKGTGKNSVAQFCVTESESL
jgi:diguanylate cyclase (GGDEF)-like protein